MRFEISNICTWTREGVGTKVTQPEVIIGGLTVELAAGNVKFDEFGHAFIPVPAFAYAVSCGTAKHTGKVEDYVLRSYRGVVSPFIKRELAPAADFVAVILYTRKGYLTDPDVQGDPAEIARIQASDCEYVIVCVLASVGPKAPVAAGRFVANLAGGNPEWGKYSAAELVEKAKECIAYHDVWGTVSD
jgi:hypothetical protein